MPFPSLPLRLTVATLALAAVTARAQQEPVVRVYLLAGQSNMEGQAVADLDHPDHYNGGRGTLARLLDAAGDDARYAHLRGDDGAWTTRDDAFVWYRAHGERLETGPLTVGFGSYAGGHHFGPELQFGHVVADHHADPVLLVKTCWGGKSLFGDFRPPSAGGETGAYYRRMLAEYREAVASLGEVFPALAGHRPVLTGMVWFQGWNDMIDANARSDYAVNLAHLIRDVRRDLDAPTLPVVVGETGNAGDASFRAAQAEGVRRLGPDGRARFVPTRAFLRPAEDSPNRTHAHHWFGNAASVLDIGDAFGVAMLELLAAAPPTGDRARIREDFTLAGRPAFVILPERSATARATPWVFYAPTLPGLPGNAEAWMFERFLDAGIAIAGIDVGESYGSPAGRALYTALHDHLRRERGFAPRPCLLARSRGGLMLYNWAVEHADEVAGIAGIYPVCSPASYPGLAKAAAAYGLSVAELAATVAEHDPVERLAPLAAAGVPLFHVHGDQDRVVPLAANSAAVRQAYTRLGGAMTLDVITGRGHDMWPGWFEHEALTAFAIARARSTAGLVAPDAASAPADAARWIGPEGSPMVPMDDEVPCRWRFEDGALIASPAWDSVVTAASYGDFRMHIEFAVNATDAGRELEARGNSGIYIQQRYEVQIHDSFGISADDYLPSYCASLYRLKAPDRIACRPPGVWQHYDIAFRAARFRGATKIHDARITVFHNGELVHDDVAIPRKTGAGRAEGPAPGPIQLQGHRNEVRFRNFWVQPLD